MKRLISTILVFTIMLSMVTIVQAADFSGGGYNFVCADGGRYLNVYAGKDADGTNVCVWERDGSPEQNYTISACGGGKYKLHPACSSSRVIDVNRGNSYDNPLKAGLNVDLWRTNDAPAQEFYITHVGNNLYKIELAALSGHVLQANSPNKNNGNVTLERYTGASNQHWKILKNGTQVTEPCTHSDTVKKNEKSNITKNDDNTHTITTTYDEVCNDCGKTVKSNQKKTNSEKHSISNNKCTKCGYEVPVVEEKCNHSKTKENWQSATVSQKDDTYHTVEETYDVICADCNETLKKSQNKTYDERHSLKNDECEKCSYVVPGSEASICKHKNTAKHSSDDMKTTISIKDDNQHTIASYYHVWCTDCFTYIKENELDLVHEDHKFVNNICSVCNLENLIARTATVKDGLYNIKNVSSGYMMNIYAGKDANGTKVTMWQNDNSNDQKIYISHQGDGKYLLKYNASKNGRVVDVNRGNSMTASINDGDKIDIWTSNDPEAQLFFINDCGGGKYTFELVSSPGYVISPVSISGAKTNGSQLELKKDANADYQKWYVVTPSIQENTNTTTSSTIKAKYQSIVNNVGWQTKKTYSNWDWMCGCYATAYAHSYLSGKIHQPSEYWKSASDATTHWTRAGGNRTTKSNNNQVLAAVKSEIDKGKPCVIRVNSSYGGHYVLVITYTGNGNRTSDFTVVDPWDGKFKSLSNFTIHSSNKQVVVF